MNFYTLVSSIITPVHDRDPIESAVVERWWQWRTRPLNDVVISLCRRWHRPTQPTHSLGH